MQKNPIIIFNQIPSFLNPARLKTILKEYVQGYGFTIDQLVYNFVSKEQLYEMNAHYLNHQTDTDIITFDYSSGESLKAEFFISMWAIVHSAQTESQSIENETLRVIIHGVLHCLGYNDQTKDEKTQMRNLEDGFLKLFHVKPFKDV